MFTLDPNLYVDSELFTYMIDGESRGLGSGGGLEFVYDVVPSVMVIFPLDGENLILDCIEVREEVGTGKFSLNLIFPTREVSMPIGSYDGPGLEYSIHRVESERLN